MLIKNWDKLIQEFEESGKSQAQWCREKNLKIKAFNYRSCFKSVDCFMRSILL